MLLLPDFFSNKKSKFKEKCKFGGTASDFGEMNIPHFRFRADASVPCPEIARHVGMATTS